MSKTFISQVWFQRKDPKNWHKPSVKKSQEENRRRSLKSFARSAPCSRDEVKNWARNIVVAAAVLQGLAADTAVTQPAVTTAVECNSVQSVGATLPLMPVFTWFLVPAVP